MNRKDVLLQRLEEIGRSVEGSGHGLAVIGLGSVGLERHRVDDYSDLDFFVIVEDGYKARVLDDLDWLRVAAPIGYSFRNTVDGHKVLFADGVFCEFAVFEAAELPRIPFAPGRMVWKRPQVPETLAVPVHLPHPPEGRTEAWLLGEALTNLYVGLGRFRRGEKLAAARLVQTFAVDRVIELHELQMGRTGPDRDPFASERRLERRHPEWAALLPTFVPGYELTPAAARAILEYLSARYEVNALMAAEIRALAEA